eukprot:scaffold27948_cov51-Phaeocystis_antarctica.AAC.2
MCGSDHATTRSALASPAGRTRAAHSSGPHRAARACPVQKARARGARHRYMWRGWRHATKQPGGRPVCGLGGPMGRPSNAGSFGRTAQRAPHPSKAGSSLAALERRRALATDY